MPGGVPVRVFGVACIWAVMAAIAFAMSDAQPPDVLGVIEAHELEETGCSISTVNTASGGGGEGVGANERLLVHMHAHLDITRPAPEELEGHADTTWNCDPDCYAMIVTRYGGALVHGVWRMALQCDSSCLSEAVGSAKCAEKLALIQEFERELRVKDEAH